MRDADRGEQRRLRACESDSGVGHAQQLSPRAEGRGARGDGPAAAAGAGIYASAADGAVVGAGRASVRDRRVRRPGWRPLRASIRLQADRRHAEPRDGEARLQGPARAGSRCPQHVSDAGRVPDGDQGVVHGESRPPAGDGHDRSEGRPRSRTAPTSSSSSRIRLARGSSTRWTPRFARCFPPIG